MGAGEKRVLEVWSRCRWWRVLALVPVLVACKSVVLPTNGPQNLSDYAPRGQIGLFDAKQRRAELKNNPEQARVLCPSNIPRLVDPIPQRVVGHGTRFTIYNQPNPFTGLWLHVDDAVGGWLTSGDRAFLDVLRDWLLASAAADAMSDIVPDPDKYSYVDPLFNLRFGLKPLFVAYDVLRQEGALNAEQDRKIVEWLERVVNSSDRGYCGEAENWCDRPNHTTLHAGSTFMLWGGVTGNPKWFAKGIDYFVDALGNSRPDGSNQFDVSYRKGRRSLRKQNQIVGYLVMIAEIAALHGHDLYSLKVGDVSVWTTFEFLIAGIEDDAVIGRHTGEKVHGHDFLHNDKGSDETVAWFELLRSRFPNDQRVQRFEQISKANRPWSSPAYGGNLTCFTGKLIRN